MLPGEARGWINLLISIVVFMVGAATCSGVSETRTELARCAGELEHYRERLDLSVDPGGPYPGVAPPRTTALECRWYCEERHATEARYSGSECECLWVLEPDDYPIDPE